MESLKHEQAVMKQKQEALSQVQLKLIMKDSLLERKKERKKKKEILIRPAKSYWTYKKI